MLRRSGSGQDTCEVSGGILLKKRIRPTTRNTNSLMIYRRCDEAGKKDIAVAGLYPDFLSQKEQTITDIMGAILKQVCRGGVQGYLREELKGGNGCLVVEGCSIRVV